jgi:phosphonate transport system substrate-binding protein
MIDSGRIKAESVRVVWQSDPLPNDALAVARDLPRELAERAREAVLKISSAHALEIMPKRYTGFVGATHDCYRLIKNAGLALGKLKKSA